MRKLLGLLITGMVMLALGTAVIIVSHFVLGFDVYSLSTHTFETRDFDVTEEFQSIKVNVNTANVHLVPSEDESCKVTCHVKETTTCKVVVEDGVLNVTTEEEKGFASIDISWDSQIVTIALPKKTLGAVNVMTTTGDVLLSDVLSSEDVTVKTNTGDVSLKRCDAQTLYVKTNTGDVKATLLSEKKFKVKTNTGDIDIPKDGDGGTCEIITNTGDVQVEIK